MHRLFVPLALAALASNFAHAQQGSAAALPAPAATARQASPLTLRQALDLAWNTHPELAAAQREIEAVDAARIQAGALPNPTLGVEVENTHRDARTTTVLLSQPIELGGKRGARIDAAERAREIAAVQLSARRAEIRAAVSAAFFATLIAQERVRLAESSLQTARSGSQAAGKRVLAGKISPVEETKAKVAETGIALELAQARSELEISRQTLGAAMGGAATGLDRLDGSAETMPPVAPALDLSQRLAVAPAVRQAALEVDRLGALAELERAKRIPDITVGLGAKRSPEFPYDQAVIAVSVPLPIFDSNRGNMMEALRRQDKARDEARALELRLRTEALAAQQRLATARTEADTIQREVLPGAQSAFDAALKGFELGKFSFLETLDAQRTLLQARAQFLKALGEAHRAAADLDRLLGDSTPFINSQSAL
jgi:outer membrane protein, heavy metal efflux system